jgi:hypothetical protein
MSVDANSPATGASLPKPANLPKLAKRRDEWLPLVLCGKPRRFLSGGPPSLFVPINPPSGSPGTVLSGGK